MEYRKIDSGIQRTILETVGRQHLGITNDAAAQGGGLDLVPESIGLRLESAVSTARITTGWAETLKRASTTNASTSGTNSCTQTVDDTVDVRIGLQSTGAGVIACVQRIAVLGQGLGGIGGKVDSISKVLDLNLQTITSLKYVYLHVFDTKLTMQQKDNIPSGSRSRSATTMNEGGR